MHLQYLTVLPATLEEASNILVHVYYEEKDLIVALPEADYLTLSHFGAGLLIRNQWCLSWFAGHTHSHWPLEEPPLVRWFHDAGIQDPDMMSRLILTAFYEKIKPNPNA